MPQRRAKIIFAHRSGHFAPLRRAQARNYGGRDAGSPLTAAGRWSLAVAKLVGRRGGALWGLSRRPGGELLNRGLPDVQKSEHLQQMHPGLRSLALATLVSTPAAAHPRFLSLLLLLQWKRWTISHCRPLIGDGVGNLYGTTRCGRRR